MSCSIFVKYFLGLVKLRRFWLLCVCCLLVGYMPHAVILVIRPWNHIQTPGTRLYNNNSVHSTRAAIRSGYVEARLGDIAVRSGDTRSADSIMNLDLNNMNSSGIEKETEEIRARSGDTSGIMKLNLHNMNSSGIEKETEEIRARSGDTSAGDSIMNLNLNKINSSSVVQQTDESESANLNNTRYWGDAKEEVVVPIVTMFTTIRDRQCRRSIHNRTLRNWAALSPYMDPVLFVPHTEVNTSSWPMAAKSQNWDVRILHDLRNELPIIKAMFMEILKSSNTPFVGYANADILFDTSLISTLSALSKSVHVQNKMTLVVGRRRNVNVTTFDLGDGDDLDMISEMDQRQLFHGFAQDYFIISRQGLPWDDIPDFVVGRNGYDNWLVVKGQDWGLTLVDASRTLLALHQVGIDGFKSGSRTVPKDTLRLNKMLAKGFNYGRGTTACAPFYTTGNCSVNQHKFCNQFIDISLHKKPLYNGRNGTKRTKC